MCIFLNKLTARSAFLCGGPPEVSVPFDPSFDVPLLSDPVSYPDDEEIPIDPNLELRSELGKIIYLFSNYLSCCTGKEKSAYQT